MRSLAMSLGGILLAGAVFADTAAGGDPETGRALAKQCRTCHGIDGYAKIPIAPHIGGEQAAYLAAQLTAFRDGTRVHEMMSVVAKSLKDQEIADLAAWYSSQKATATVTGDAADAPEACVSCHGVDGIGQMEGVPNLAGETNIYIDTQLHAFRSGKRTHEIMSEIAKDMTDEQIRAAADWYASIQLEISPE
ncbi:c-type cytochrome [Primorskyibacter sp. 2E233]|uniref:c-type cytochrome n=1 Tax=Primorskyibacter sp. 2E233 TaxID=3413431 RepID=UPI003BF3D21A